MLLSIVVELFTTQNRGGTIQFGEYVCLNILQMGWKLPTRYLLNRGSLQLLVFFFWGDGLTRQDWWRNIVSSREWRVDCCECCLYQLRIMSTLPETNIAMENPQIWWYLPGKMGIFKGYVSLQEGRVKIFQIISLNTTGWICMMFREMVRWKPTWMQAFQKVKSLDKISRKRWGICVNFLRGFHVIMWWISP